MRYRYKLSGRTHLRWCYSCEKMKITRLIAHLLLLVAVLILRPSVTKLITRPHNMAAVVGDDVVISCSSDKDRSNSSWTRFADDGRVELFDSGQRKMNSSDRGRLDLIVEEAGVEDAGLYVCKDGDEHASAHLLIVTSSPTCSLSSGRELCAIVLVRSDHDLHVTRSHDYVICNVWRWYFFPKTRRFIQLLWRKLKVGDLFNVRMTDNSVAATNTVSVGQLRLFCHCCQLFNASTYSVNQSNTFI